MDVQKATWIWPLFFSGRSPSIGIKALLSFNSWHEVSGLDKALDDGLVASFEANLEGKRGSKLEIWPFKRTISSFC